MMIRPLILTTALMGVGLLLTMPSKGNSLLQHAVAGEDLEVPLLPIDSREDDDSPLAYGDELQVQTPLATAFRAGNLEEMKNLLKGGANPNEKNKVGATLLMEVAYTGNQEAAKILLDAGADVNAKTTADKYSSATSSLELASSYGTADMVRLLLNRGAHVNGDLDDETPLMAAAGTGKADNVKVLLEKGANVNARKGTKTALFEAVYNGRAAVVKILLDAKADTTGIGDQGLTPYGLAQKKNDSTVLQVFKDHGITQ